MKNLWCGENNEFVEYKNCEECYEDNNCDFQCEYYEKKCKNEEIGKQIRNSKLMKEIHKNLSKTFDMPEEKLMNILDQLVGNIFDISVEYINQLIKAEIKNTIQKYMDTNIKKELDGIFKNALMSEIAILKKDDKIIITSIQEKILEKTKNFFIEKEQWNNRDVENDLQKIISKTVNKKVDEALEELKKETIEKFNKEAMKSMMQGMAKQLGSDKRLMKILTSEDF